MNEETGLEIAGVTSTTALEAITRGEVDIQIATAHTYPRSITKFKNLAVELATIDESTAASCRYNRPVGGGKFASGNSIRMAEIVAASYGNLRVAAFVTEIDPQGKFVKARGFAHDLEANYASASEVIESTLKKDGTPFSERMRVVVAKACVAKARRDAIFAVVPKALCKPIEVAVEKLLLGDKSMTDRRAEIVKWIKTLSVDASRVYAALGADGISDVNTDKMMLLGGLKTAIEDGEISAAEAFPKIEKAGPGDNTPPSSGSGKVKARTTKETPPKPSEDDVDTKTGEVTEEPLGDDSGTKGSDPEGNQELIKEGAIKSLEMLAGKYGWTNGGITKFLSDCWNVKSFDQLNAVQLQPVTSDLKNTDVRRSHGCSKQT